ncbi:MAG: IPT/TIG domain-containing protein, partial [Actinobacteria bacterium]|nr:IPT/TIG domain-containing protein [Actinomycetota bacterium]
MLGSLVLPSIASAIPAASTSVMLYASPNSTSSSTTSCPRSTPCTLPNAITAASGDSGNAVTIELVHSSGASCTTSACTFDENFSVGSGNEPSLTIEGSGTGSDSSADSVLNGDNSGTTFTDSVSFSVTLENLTVTGGNSGGNGGGILNYGGTMTVTDSTISGNSASDGGGILNYGGTMTVTDSTISGNSASDGGGGGIYDFGGTMTVADSTISGNSASDGGGILNYDGTMTVTDSTISGNSASDGGGILNYDDTMTVTDSTISGNSAGASDGGGILNYGGTMTVTDSTISGNSASDGGGGIYDYGGTMTIVDSTISGNTASDGNGGGIYDYGGTIILAGSIVADQTTGSNNCYNSGSTITDAGYNLSNGTSCKFGSPSGSSTSQDSVTNLDLSTTLANNGGPTETIAIPGSSAAAAFISSPATVTLSGSTVDLCGGSTTSADNSYGGANLALDQRGVSRPATGCSAGAYQYQAPLPPPPAPVVTSVSPTSGPVAGGTTVTIDGSNLFGTAYVFFGNIAATSFSIVSSTEIQAISPPGQAGTVNITVTSPGGTSSTSSADEFTYQAPAPPRPTVTSITPTSGPTAGGTSVTITGTNFTSSATVMFGTITATAVTVNSATSITATSPAESPGTVNVTVTTTGGTSSISSTDQFTYLTPITGDAYTPVNPQRLVDTHCSASPQPSYCAGENLPSPNATLASLAGGTSENVTVTGIDGIPSNATAVVINVTALNMTTSGYFSIYPEGTTPVLVSSLNWTANSGVVTNLVTVPVNTSNGEITVANAASSNVNLIVDIEGYYAAPGSTPAGLYNAVTPTRLADSRCSESPLPTGITSSYCSTIPSANGKLATLGLGQIENVTVTGVGGIPSSGVSAVVLNLTAIEPTSSGYLTAFPTGATKAEVSTVNFNKGETTPSRVIVKVGSNGQISIYNFSGNTNFAVDVSGYYTDGSSSTQSGSLFNPVTPARILDTRCSQSSLPVGITSSYCASLPSANATLPAIAGGKSIAVQVTGIDSIPSSATAVV